ncbi:hypothetical protein COX85_01995 [Candidatus Micrarchaeota archaeon CG_4_10_14_0_2_um_filter_55_9]|nr:MAG: hypothetical protein COX85_01995 [Candidatus Micrarchaeota archaeon CG_4_10_14_0_2_um_filter_55_9]PJD00832.1 MAG: hypothetical protein COU38_04230 [Candidatus Micrarchaeota archaeon CG10_big_fil_rev_8_21_14_0_10_54_18]
MLKMGTRHSYIVSHLKTWKAFVRYRLYAVVALVAGLYFMFTFPLLAVPAMWVAGYTFILQKMYYKRSIASNRTVMLGA